MHRAVQQTGRAGVEYNSVKFPSCSCFVHTKMLWLQRRVAEGQVKSSFLEADIENLYNLKIGADLKTEMFIFGLSHC